MNCNKQGNHCHLKTRWDLNLFIKVDLMHNKPNLLIINNLLLLVIQELKVFINNLFMVKDMEHLNLEELTLDTEELLQAAGVNQFQEDMVPLKVIDLLTQVYPLKVTTLQDD